jgi:hypothetical protein
VELLQRAIHLLSPEALARVDALIALGRAMFTSGRIEEAGGVLQRAVASATQIDEGALLWRARLAWADCRTYTEAAGLLEAHETLAKEAITALEALGDDRGLAAAYNLFGLVQSERGQFGPWAESCERQVFHARRSGDSSLERLGLRRLATALFVGPTPISEAIERCEAIESEATSASVRLRTGQTLA